MYPASSWSGGKRVPTGAVDTPKHAWSNRNPARRIAIVMFSVLLAVTAGLLVFDEQSGATTAGSKVNTCSGDKLFLNAREMKTFIRHNEIRRRHHLPTFCVAPALERAARHHSEDMIRRDYFSHDTLNSTEGMQERIQSFGYRNFSLIAENIAYGGGSAGDPDKIMRSWMNSAGHRRNILDSELRQIGIGVYTGTWQGHRNVSMYTVDFGAKRH